ncbi:MAG: ABC transporter transmembrane domain-containing protein [Pseudomonadota bacterium]
MSRLSALQRIRYDPHVMMASLTANFLGMALPITMIQVYDRIIPNAAYETLTVLALGVFIAILGETVIRLARGAILSEAGYRFERAIQDQVIQSMLMQVSGKTRGLSPGAYFNRMQSIDRIRAHYSGDATVAFLDIPFVIIFSAIMIMISPVLGLTVALFVCLVFASVHLLRRRTIAINEERHAEDEKRQSFLIETLTGIEFIKSTGIEDLLERRYERLMSGAAPIGARLSAQIQFTQGFTSAVGLMAPVVTAGVGALLVMQGQMTVGGLAASVLLTGRIIQPVLRMEAMLVGQEDIRRAEEDLASLLGDPSARAPTSFDVQPIDRLELCNVTWGPGNGADPVFRDINLRLDRGDCISFQGRQGAGKSLLMSLMAGFTEPTEGEVLYNGVPAQDIGFPVLTDRVSLLTRSHGLLEGTLAENATGFRGKDYLPQAISIMSKLGIDSYVASHRDGLNMKLFPGGKSGLPTAISDCVVITGALVNGPDIVLFDEANVRLDHEQDTKLLAFLSALRPHVIMAIVSNRPSFLQLAREHFEFHDGRLVPCDAPLPLALAHYGQRVA